MRTNANRSRRAFTFMELMIVVVVIAIFTVMAMPDEKTESRAQLAQASEKLQADLSFARSGSIAMPDDKLVLVASVDQNMAWIASASQPRTPIDHPLTGKPYLVAFGADGGAEFDRVKIHAIDFGGDGILGFDALGATDQDTAAVIQFMAGDVKTELIIAPAAAQATSTDAWDTTISGDGKGYTIAVDLVAK